MSEKIIIGEIKTLKRDQIFAVKNISLKNPGSQNLFEKFKTCRSHPALRYELFNNRTYRNINQNI